MVTFHITARNDDDGEIYAYQIRTSGDLLKLVDLFNNEATIIKSKTVGHLISYLEADHEILEIHTF